MLRIAEVIGYIGRVGSAYDVTLDVYFILQICCLIFAPAFFSAGLYLAIGTLYPLRCFGVTDLVPWSLDVRIPCWNPPTISSYSPLSTSSHWPSKLLEALKLLKHRLKGRLPLQRRTWWFPLLLFYYWVSGSWNRCPNLRQRGVHCGSNLVMVSHTSQLSSTWNSNAVSQNSKVPGLCCGNHYLRCGNHCSCYLSSYRASTRMARASHYHRGLFLLSGHRADDFMYGSLGDWASWHYIGEGTRQPWSMRRAAI